MKQWQIETPTGLLPQVFPSKYAAKKFARDKLKLTDYNIVRSKT